jgi:glycosyltransferase involved in cell wall biosynthesis
MVPVKRVDLILRGIDHVARLRPDVHFVWHHFGGGELKRSIELQAQATLPPNVTATFPGYPGLSELMNFYRTQPVDVFMNASISEGTPVAMMEAVSCGIPVVATAVGGNPEIVSDENGALLGPNPSPEEIAAALLELLDRPDMATTKRRGSRRVWEAKYDAATSYAGFAARLKDLRTRD